MNMKKKSLVAGLLAVSLAAQPVAATIAPKAVHAEGSIDWNNVLGETTPKNFNEAVGIINDSYLKNTSFTSKIDDNVTLGDAIEALEKVYDGYNDLQKKVAKDSCKIDGKDHYETYQIIVKEWKDSNVASDAQTKAAKEFVEKIKDIRVGTGEKVGLLVTLEEEKEVLVKEDLVKELYKEYTTFNKEQKAIVNEVVSDVKNTENRGVAIITHMTSFVKEEVNNLAKFGSLKEISDFIDKYNSEEDLKNFGKDIKNEALAKIIAEKQPISERKPISERINNLLKVVLPRYEEEYKKLITEGSKAKVSELEAFKEKISDIPAKFLEETVVVNYYTNDGKLVDGSKENESNGTPVKLAIETTKTIDLKEIDAKIKKLKDEAKNFNERMEKLVNQENPSKGEAIAIASDYSKLEENVKELVNKELYKLVEDIIAGKPVAPVKETYYSLGVNVRDAEENLLGRLDRGFVIENAVKKGNYIHFTYEGKEARAHINFVSKEKPLAAFYSKGGNVRETPDTKGLKLGYLPVNQIVLGEVTEDGVWVEIEFNGRKAFIANNRLSKEAVEVRYTSVGANVRNAAGEKVGYYKAGEVFKGVKEGNRIKVDYKGAVGYVHVAFVK